MNDYKKNRLLSIDLPYTKGKGRSLQEKRFYNKEKFSLKGFHHWLKVHPIYHDWLILELRKGLIILVAQKRKDTKLKTFDIFHNSTQQLLLYYDIYFL